MLAICSLPPCLVQSAVEAAIAIHKDDQPGDILIFLTGQDECEAGGAGSLCCLADCMPVIAVPAGQLQLVCARLLMRSAAHCNLACVACVVL